jgi:urease accessory protein
MKAAQHLEWNLAHEDLDWSRIEAARVRGTSRVVASKSVVPLRIHNPRAFGPGCHVLLANYGGGLVDGDTASLEIICRQGARLSVGSVGSVQVYSSPIQGALQNVRGIVESDALTVFSSDPVVLHTDSVCEQKQEWQVAPDASLLVADLLVSGRLETGERFTFKQYAAEISIHVGEELVIYDRFVFRPSTFNYTDPAVLAGRSCFLSMYMVGARWSSLAERFIDPLQSMTEPVDSSVLASVHPLEEHGYIFRAVANKPRELAEFLDWTYDFLEDREFLGFNPRTRKY